MNTTAITAATYQGTMLSARRIASTNEGGGGSNIWVLVAVLWDTSVIVDMGCVEIVQVHPAGQVKGVTCTTDDTVTCITRVVVIVFGPVGVGYRSSKNLTTLTTEDSPATSEYAVPNLRFSLFRDKTDQENYPFACIKFSWDRR